MIATNRRAVLTGMVAGAISAGSGSFFAPARAGEALALPPAPMVLNRRLERGMGGGATITVERDWSVRFARQGSGVAVSGVQLEVQVDAPPSLARLAQIEAARSTDTLFPIMLSDRGVIVGGGPFVLQGDLDRAVGEARQIIADQPLPPDSVQERLYYLAILQRSAGRVLDHLPPDLFFPTGAPVRSMQELALPGGGVGEYELRYEAHSAGDGVWLGAAEREIVTRIGATERRSREVWSLRRF